MLRMHANLDTVASLDAQVLTAEEQMVQSDQSRRAQLAADVRSLQTRRNALAPLCRLPPELLDRILHIAVTDARPAFHLPAGELLLHTLSHPSAKPPPIV
jgi:hypothetical protein